MGSSLMQWFFVTMYHRSMEVIGSLLTFWGSTCIVNIMFDYILFISIILYDTTGMSHLKTGVLK